MFNPDLVPRVFYLLLIRRAEEADEIGNKVGFIQQSKHTSVNIKPLSQGNFLL